MQNCNYRVVIEVKVLFLLLFILMNCSSASAYTPTISLEISDDHSIYNPEIVQKLVENLTDKLAAEDKFIITDSNEADYRIEGKVIGIGTGKLVSNPMGTAYTISGSAASLFISPFTGPVIGGIGLMQTRKHVFAIGVLIDIIRTADDKVVKRRAFLGRTNLKKSKLSQEVIDSTIVQTTELISTYLVKDVNRKKPKYFIQPSAKKSSEEQQKALNQIE